MDVFKLTFETTIVGISAFLWIGIAIDLISPTFLVWVKALLAESKNQSVTAAVLLACAYCLGSAILPISGQLVNDEHWPVREEGLRCRVAVEETNRLRALRPNNLATSSAEPDSSNCDRPFLDRFRNRQPGASIRGTGFLVSNVDDVEADSGERERNLILAAFELKESRTLGQGAEKEELFKQLRERVTVLRGAFFSALVAVWICGFACIAPQERERFRWARKVLGVGLALYLMRLLLRSAYEDLMHPTIFDIPILEIVLITITVFGAFLVIKGVRRPCFLRLQFLLAITLCAALSYGGWIWSEILYDRQVISSSAVLDGMHDEAGAPHAAPGKAASSNPQRPEPVDQEPEVH